MKVFEIRKPKVLEKILGPTVEIFCWVSEIRTLKILVKHNQVIAKIFEFSKFVHRNITVISRLMQIFNQKKSKIDVKYFVFRKSGIFLQKMLAENFFILGPHSQLGIFVRISIVSVVSVV